MKKLVALLTVFAMAATLCIGCGASTTEEAPAEEATEEAPAEEAAEEEAAEAPAQMIGFSFPTSNNEFWQICLGYFNAACDQLGIEGFADDCNNDTAEQLADVETMISKGITGLVLGPQDASVIAGVCGACKDAGVNVVLIDRAPEDDVTAGEDYICFIGPDDTTCGYNQAMALIESGCTKIVALCGFKGTSVAEGRYAGLAKAIEENPDVELVGEDWCGENMDDGDKAIRNLYSAHDDLDGVWCYNDSLGLASVNVMKELGVIDKVHVGGMDGLSDAAASIQSGEMFFTCGGHYMMPAMATVVLYDAANGVEYSEDAVTKLTLLGIDAEHADQYVADYVESNATIDWAAKSKANGGGDYAFATMLGW